MPGVKATCHRNNDSGLNINTVVSVRVGIAGEKSVDWIVNTTPIVVVTICFACLLRQGILELHIHVAPQLRLHAQTELFEQLRSCLHLTAFGKNSYCI